MPEDTAPKGQGVHGVAEVKMAIVNFVDGHGKEQTRFALVMPDGQVRLLKDNGEPAQAWLGAEILKHLKKA